MILYISLKHIKLHRAQVILVSQCEKGARQWGRQCTCRTRGAVWERNLSAFLVSFSKILLKEKKI